MKMSSKPRHYAPRWTGMDNKNHSGHRSHGGAKTPARARNLAMEFVRFMMGVLPRRTRRVYMEQEAALQKKQQRS